MIMLYNSQSLEGDADVASTVIYTVMGTVNGIDQVLSQGELGTSAGSLYTVAASTAADVSSIYIFNGDTSIHYVSLYINGTAGSNSLISFILGPKTTAVYEAGSGWSLHSEYVTG